MKSLLNRVVPMYGLALMLVLCGLHAVAQGPIEPAAEHQFLKRLAGEWTAMVKGEGGISRGTMVAKMECGGLWLVTDFHADFGGMPFHGRGMDGYDPASRKYVSTWVDSMSTKPLLFEGTMDKGKKTLTMLAEGVGMDGKPAKFKSVTQYLDDDHHVFTLSMVGADGTEQKMMSIEYVRKK